MDRLEYHLRQTKHDPCKQKEEILVEIQQLRNAKEEASENVDHRGKLPASSECREDVEKKIKVRKQVKQVQDLEALVII